MVCLSIWCLYSNNSSKRYVSIYVIFYIAWHTCKKYSRSLNTTSILVLLNWFYLCLYFPPVYIKVEVSGCHKSGEFYLETCT